MAGRDIRAGRAFVELYIKNNLTRGLRRISANLQGFGAAVSGIGARITALGATAATPFGLAIRSASNLEETLSKFGVVFGDRTSEVKAWGDEFSKSVGRSQEQTARFLASMQDLFVPLGFSADAAENMSKQMTQLAVDLGSFNNRADDAVLIDLQAALTGSGEVMKKYGVVLTEAAVKQELLNQGLDPKKITDQQKVMARMNIIMRGTTAAQGDAVRTAGSFANQMKALQGNIADTAATVGTMLLPIVTPLVTQFSQGIIALSGWLQQNQSLVIAAAQASVALIAAGAAFIGLGTAISTAGTAIGGVAAVLTTLGGTFTFVMGLMNPITLAVVGLSAALIDFQKLGASIGETFQETWISLGEMFGKVFQEVKASLAAGDLENAFKITGVALKVTFLEIKSKLLTIWDELLDGMKNRWNTFWEGVQEFAFNSVGQAIPIPLLGGGADDTQSRTTGKAAFERAAELEQAKRELGDLMAGASLDRAGGFDDFFATSAVASLSDGEKFRNYFGFSAPNVGGAAQGIFGPLLAGVLAAASPDAATAVSRGSVFSSGQQLAMSGFGSNSPEQRTAKATEAISKAIEEGNKLLGLIKRSLGVS